MPLDAGAVGREGTIVAEVEDGHSAHAHGNTGLHALATPALVGLFERAAMASLDGVLAPDERSVGSVVEITHQAPTPLGVQVTVTARVTEVEGRQVWFELAAVDAQSTIAAGRHSRFVVDDARFQARLDAKRSA
jgi:fluoroacetyl-CoA thioesterase